MISKRVLIQRPYFPRAWVLAALVMSWALASNSFAQDEIGDVLIKPKVEAFTPANFQSAKPYLDRAMSASIETLVTKAMKLDTGAMLTYGFSLELGRTPVTGAIPESDRGVLLRAFSDTVRELKLTGLNDKIKNQRGQLLDYPEFWEILAEDLSEHRSKSFEITNSGSDGGDTMIQQKSDYDFGHIEQPTIWAAKSCAMDARTFQKTTKLEGLDPDQFKTLTREAYLRVRRRAEIVRADSWNNGVKTCGGGAYFMQLTEFASQNLGPLSQLKDDPTYTPAVITDLTPSVP